MSLHSKAASQEEKLIRMSFSKVYPLYVQKVVRKGRTEEELLSVIQWLTGYNAGEIKYLAESSVTFSQFFDKAQIHPLASEIRGAVCGVHIEMIQNPVARLVRILDKLVDDLAKGKPLEKILPG
ncbi:hypothetical protein JCM31826_00170 [Thermaurantimonas aggregans]|uniref:DUF2200 domain-containing protein n=1 Tax=Thermaurantimonas aggregans TaxID=2173829 RepID=A0A401XHQ4_9FLAO|nr:DUF2200 family protein [Thermaurantimonas aggregans]MCX8149845.1 DUF2200 domain-containing protein [Thermaurantimonas aggregans]GCD76535.1 hypothetical protein JCM31826_00170 [Thermaurantimonas aggregans]